MGCPAWGFRELYHSLNNLNKCIIGEDKYYIDNLRAYIQFTYGVESCIVTELGRQALYLGLCELGLQKGDRIYLPSYVCLNVLLPVLALDCEPVFIDIQEESCNISPQSLIDNLKFGGRCLIIPHLYGQAAPINELISIAEDNDVLVIDDAAQAVGAKVNNRYLGTYGDIGILSFGLYKSIISSRGGVLLTHSKKHLKDIENKNTDTTMTGYKRLLKILLKYSFRKYTFKFLHTSKRIKNKKTNDDNINYSDVYPISILPLDAAIAFSQLKKSNQIIKRRIELATYLYDLLKHFSWLTSLQRAHNIFVKYVVIINNRKLTRHFIRFLNFHGIEAHAGYNPLHKVFPRTGTYASLENTEKIWDRIVCLPINSFMKFEHIEYIYSVFKKFEKEYI